MPGNEWREANRWYNPLRYARERCQRKGHEHYPFYGGRGIKCTLTAAEWKQIWERDGGENMKRPSIERKDPDGHYEFGNVEVVELEENLHRARIARRDRNLRWVKKDRTSAKRKPPK